MRRTIRLQIRTAQVLSANFLWGLIVEWSFPMLFDGSPTYWQWMIRRPARCTIDIVRMSF